MAASLNLLLHSKCTENSKTAISASMLKSTHTQGIGKGEVKQ